jgi:predicted nucleic acid-binding protein
MHACMSVRSKLAGEHNVSATYDAHYLALAQRLRAPLWTCGRRLTDKLNAEVPVVHLVP